jgi:hypothetical protein
MLTEIGSELIVVGFVKLVHRLWDFLNKEQLDEGFFPIELAGMSTQEYQDLVTRFVPYSEEN